MSKESFDPRTAKLKQVRFSELEVGDIFFYGGWMAQKTQVYSIGGMHYNHRMLIANKLGCMANTSKVWVEDVPPVVRLKDLMPGEFFTVPVHKGCLFLKMSKLEESSQAARMYTSNLVDRGTTWLYSELEVVRIENPFLSKSKLPDEDE